MRCTECRRTMPAEASICPSCGHHNVSVADDRLDSMVQSASVPDLATLFRKAKDSGVIKGFDGYPGSA